MYEVVFLFIVPVVSLVSILSLLIMDELTLVKRQVLPYRNQGVSFFKSEKQISWSSHLFFESVTHSSVLNDPGIKDFVGFRMQEHSAINQKPKVIALSITRKTKQQQQKEPIKIVQTELKSCIRFA